MLSEEIIALRHNASTSRVLPENAILIDEELKFVHPFKRMKSNVSIAITLGFVGTRDEVLDKMRMFTKTGRAYILHKRGEPGFILEYHTNLMHFLKDYQSRKYDGMTARCDADPEELLETLA